MNILEFKMYYEPEITSGIALDSDTAEDLAANGHTVMLFVPTPSRGITKEQAKAVLKCESKINDNLKIYRYAMYSERGGLVARSFRYLLCSIKQLWIGLTVKEVDLVFAGSTPPFQGIVCALIKKVRKLPFVFNCQDVFPDSMVSAGITTNKSLLYKIGYFISNATYRAADSIIVISKDMMDNLITKGVPSEKINVVYNWVDESVIHPIEAEDNRLYEELKIPQYPFTVVYAGNLGYAQALDVIIGAAKQLRNNSEIGFVIFGNGTKRADIEKEVKMGSLGNVSLYSLQPYERVSEVYSLGDACIVSCKTGTGANAVPSKTWSIMGSGRAVLASFDEGTLLERVLLENNCGLFSHAGNVEELVSNILYLSTHKKICAQMGANGRAFVENNLTRKKCTNNIKEIIEKAYLKECN